jgi:anhydro-N-acetylmuramic acid kinase
MLIDALVSHFSGGRQRYDKNGAMARRGRVMEDVLECVLRHPYFALSPPKSCGREEFGAGYAAELLRRFGRRGRTAEDWIATATRVTAVSIADAYGSLWKCMETESAVLEIILCGGGTKNGTLVDALDTEVSRRLRFDCDLAKTDDYGLSTQAKETVSFAMLAAARDDAVPTNLLRVTGARARAVLGVVTDCRVSD